MEVDPCIERLGKTSIAGNRESNSYDYADLFIEHWSVSTKWSDENMHKTLLTSTDSFQCSSQENQGQRKIKMVYHMNFS
jgi:hypothetical protein